MGAIFELLLASLVLVWGFFELRSHRRYKREMEEKERLSADGKPAGDETVER